MRVGLNSSGRKQELLHPVTMAILLHLLNFTNNSTQIVWIALVLKISVAS